MNSFGRILRISMLGESHGPSVGVLIDGCPAGLPLVVDDFLPDLERRKSGQPGTTGRREEDVPSLISGLFNGHTTGTPLLILFENKDVDSGAYERITSTPRPGHADFVAFKKSGGFNDYRGGGAFSGRLTAALVAAGVVAKKLIRPVSVEARLLEAGGSTNIAAAVERAALEQDSVGGVIECRGTGLPVGLGEPFFDSAESLLSLPAVVLNPCRHQVEHLSLEVPRAALRILTAAHQSGIFQHLEVLGHSLDRDVVRGGKLAHRGIPDG